MVKVILGSSSDDKKSSLEDLKHKVASYLYDCSCDWQYSYQIFDNRLVVLTDFGISKMVDFVSVLRDTCRHSEFWFIVQIEYTC